MNGIRLSGLSKSFGSRNILDKVDLELPSRGFYVLHGHSGCGKSTLLDILAGLESKDEGDAFIFGSRVDGSFPDRSIDIGYIRQSYDLVEDDTVLQNAMLPIEMVKEKPFDPKKRAKSVLGKLGLRSKLKQKAATLSGGEKARLAIARALVLDPLVILADEPTGALDEKNAREVYALLSEISKTRLVFMVSHDEERTRDFVDGAYRLREGKIHRIFERERAEERKGNRRRFSRRDGTSLLLRIAGRRMSSRKIETGFFLSVLAFSFSVLGIGTYVSSTLPEVLSSNFKELTGENEIHVVMRDNPQSIKARYSTLSEVMDLSDAAGEFSYGVGVSYLANWENNFRDRNEGRVIYLNREWTVPGLGLRSINDYFCYPQDGTLEVYPEVPSVMEDDQVILGLPNEEMTRLALTYNIGRTYKDIGNFLRKTPMELLIFVENASWGYDDEQLLEVVGIAKTDEVSLVHSCPFWNQTMFEERMRLPAYVEEGDSSEPWALIKAGFIRPSIDPTDFMEAVEDNPSYEGYCLARGNRDLNRAFYGGGPVSSLPRIYPYALSGYPFDMGTLKEVVGRSETSSFLRFGSGAYLTYPDALASGFSSPFYVSGDRETLEITVEDLPSYDSEGGRGLPSPSPGVEVGCCLLPRNQSLILETEGECISGRMPENLDEIGISEKLYEALGRPETISVAGLRGVESVSGDKVKDVYTVVELTVVGVFQSLSKSLMVGRDWPTSFFRDRIGVDALSLLTSSCIMKVSSGVSTSSYASFLNARYPSLRFVDPSSKIESGIGEAISYMGKVIDVLVAFSTVSAVLVCVGISISGSVRARKEGRALYLLGFAKNDVAMRDFFSLGLPVFISLIFSSVSILVLECVANMALSDTFGSGISLMLDWRPVGVVCLFALVSLSAISILTWVLTLNRSFKRNEIS